MLPLTELDQLPTSLRIPLKPCRGCNVEHRLSAPDFSLTALEKNPIFSPELQ